MKFWMIFFGLMAFAGIAIGQEAAEMVKVAEQEVPKELWQMVVEKIGQSMGVDNFLATYILVMTGLRALAEGGGYLADKTGAKWDNKLIQWMCKGLNAVSWVAGLFGLGTPKHTKTPKVIIKKGA